MRPDEARIFRKKQFSTWPDSVPAPCVTKSAILSGKGSRNYPLAHQRILGRNHFPSTNVIPQQWTKYDNCVVKQAVPKMTNSIGVLRGEPKGRDLGTKTIYIT